jgi:hypothetical protein
MKKFWEQVFLGFHGKNHLFQRKSGYSDICLSILCLSDVTLSNGTMHLDEKVLGTSFSWISWKKSLVPTSVRLFRFCSSILCLSDVTLSNGTMHVDEKVLGTSFSWISWKKSLVPT